MSFSSRVSSSRSDSADDELSTADGGDVSAIGSGSGGNGITLVDLFDRVPCDEVGVERGVNVEVTGTGVEFETAAVAASGVREEEDEGVRECEGVAVAAPIVDEGVCAAADAAANVLLPFAAADARNDDAKGVEGDDTALVLFPAAGIRDCRLLPPGRTSWLEAPAVADAADDVDVIEVAVDVFAFPGTNGEPRDKGPAAAAAAADEEEEEETNDVAVEGEVVGEREMKSAVRVEMDARARPDRRMG